MRTNKWNCFRLCPHWNFSVIVHGILVIVSCTTDISSPSSEICNSYFYQLRIRNDTGTWLYSRWHCLWWSQANSHLQCWLHTHPSSRISIQIFLTQISSWMQAAKLQFLHHLVTPHKYCNLRAITQHYISLHWLYKFLWLRHWNCMGKHRLWFQTIFLVWASISLYEISRLYMHVWSNLVLYVDGQYLTLTHYVHERSP